MRHGTTAPTRASGGYWRRYLSILGQSILVPVGLVVLIWPDPSELPARRQAVETFLPL